MKYRLKQKNSPGLQPQYQLVKGEDTINFPKESQTKRDYNYISHSNAQTVEWQVQKMRQFKVQVPVGIP